MDRRLEPKLQRKANTYDTCVIQGEVRWDIATDLGPLNFYAGLIGEGILH